jgi:acyl-CoA carboxylase subunit beta
VPTVRLSAADWKARLLDEATAEEVVAGIRSGDPLRWPGYAETLERLADEEAVRVWVGAIHGTGCVLIAFDFTHLGGSLGVAVGARVAEAFDLARERRLPVVTVASTGGSRMQEGTVALSQMARTTVAALAHRRAGLLHVGVAADPTTGGVYASFLSQADLLAGVAGAYIGFAGPRVAAAVGDGPPPPGTNDAAFARQHGLVDVVVEGDGVRAWLASVWAATAAPTGELPPPPQTPRPSALTGGWQAVQSARAPHRPRAAEYVAKLAPSVRLSGDRAGGVDDGVIACLGRLHGCPVAVVGLDRRRVMPAGYRTAWRLFALAERLGTPVVTLVDTPGADPGPTAESLGQAHAISTTLARLLELQVPTVAVVIGEGGSGGAMALSATDRLFVQQGAIFSVIAPEGAAAILHRDPGRAADVAGRLQLGAGDLVRLGVADGVAPDDPAATLEAVAAELHALAGMPASERLAERLQRWRRVGDAHVVR